MKGKIGNYDYKILAPGKWEVRRGDFLMAVLGSLGEVERYCDRKDHEDNGNAAVLRHN